MKHLYEESGTNFGVILDRYSVIDMWLILLIFGNGGSWIERKYELELK